MTDLPTFQKNPRYERYRWQIFAVTWLAYAGFYLTRKSFSVAKIALNPETAGQGKDLLDILVAFIQLQPEKVGIACYRSTDFFLTTQQMAWIDGAYLVAYAVGQFVWGMLGDRLGTRAVILSGMLCSVFAGFMMGISSITVIFGLFFIIQGLCQSSGWAPLSKNIGNFFSQHERGTVMGLWCTNYATGGLIASSIAGASALYFCDWRYAFYIPATALFLIWLLFLFFQVNKPEDVGLPNIDEYHKEKEAVIDEHDKPVDEKEGTWHVIFQVLRNRMVLLLAGIYFLLKPTRYAILFWGPLYINEKLGSDIFESGLLSSLFELAGPITVFFAGYISDKYFDSKRMPVSIMCLFVLAVMLFFLDSMPATKLALGLSFFAIGFFLFAPDSLLSGTAALDFGTRKGASTAAGLINGSGSIGAIVGGTFPGFFKQKWGWNGVFVSLACCILLAAIILIPQWNTLPKTADESGR